MGAIARYAPEWPFDQIAAIDRNIPAHGYLGIRRLQGDTLKVAINEAVENWQTIGSDQRPVVLSTACWAACRPSNTSIAQQFQQKL